jgi:spermidine synthase
LNYYGPWSQVLVAPYFNAPPLGPKAIENLAIIGLAAGTTARQAQAVFGDIKIDGFEIDPLIVEVGREYFDMNQPNLTVYVQDGRWGLSRIENVYDVISVDAYRPPYIPWHMTTLEFFEIVHQRLSEDGVMVINIGRSPLDRTLIDDLSTTIRQLFPTVFVMDVPDSFNTILFATKQPGRWDNLLANYDALQYTEVHPLLLEAMALTITFRQPTPGWTRVYTDDLAPIELLTNKIVYDYFISGGLEDLQ